MCLLAKFCSLLINDHLKSHTLDLITMAAKCAKVKHINNNRPAIGLSVYVCGLSVMIRAPSSDQCTYRTQISMIAAGWIPK